MSCLPYLTLQPTFPAVFEDLSSGSIAYDKVWLSVYARNAPSASIHAILDLEPCKPRDGDASTQAGVSIQDVRFKTAAGAASGLRVQRVPGHALDLSVSAAGSGETDATSGSMAWATPANSTLSRISFPPTILRLPRRNLATPLTAQSGVTAFDISPARNDLFVAGGGDGQLLVGKLGSLHPSGSAEEGGDGAEGETSMEGLSAEARLERLAQQCMQKALARRGATGDERVQLKGHVGDLRHAKFFPSGEVVLSAASDMSVRIFSAVDGSNPRTLRGHRGAVLCSAMIGRGREIVTGSSDGTLRQWDVSEGAQKALIGAHRHSGVQALAMLDDEATLVAGLSSGVVEMVDLRSKKATLRIPPPTFPPGAAPGATDSWQQSRAAGVTALALDSQRGLLACGTSNGIASVWDLHALRTASLTNDPESDPPGDEPISDAMPGACVALWSRNSAAINDMRWRRSAQDESGARGTGELDLACSDGLAYAVRPFEAMDAAGSDPASGLTPPQMDVEYAGWDAGENIESVRYDSHGNVWLAGCGGMLRRY